jgi:hypothetical protein
VEFIPFVALLAFNKKAVDFIKELLPAGIRNKTVQLVSWAVGIGSVFLYANSDWGSDIQAGGKTLASLNGLGLVAVGLAVGAAAGVVNDAIERRNPDVDKDPAVLGNET